MNSRAQPARLPPAGRVTFPGVSDRVLARTVAGLFLLAAGGVPVWSQRVGLETDFEALWASDVRLFQGTAAARLESPQWQTKLEFSTASIGVDYRPNDEVDLTTVPRVLDEIRVSSQLSARWRAGERWTILGGGGGYDGFTSHRPLWINEWYQQWFAGLPGLRDADPHGGNVTGGVRWEYAPTTGFIQTEFTYARDIIAPGYEEVLDPELGLVAVEPLRDTLNTGAWKVAFENVLTPRLRSSLEFRLASQSERGLRLGGVAGLNYAFAEHWVLRGEGGYANEALDPENVPTSVRTDAFEAWWVSGTLERRLGEHWWLSAAGRYYADNGEIESSISFSSAAPSVRAWHAGLGLRWAYNDHSLKLYGGPYFTGHDPVDFGTLFFQPLYRDRAFALVQAAYTFDF